MLFFGKENSSSLKITNLNDRHYDDLSVFGDSLGFKVSPAAINSSKVLIVIDFDGDVEASDGYNLAEKVTAIIGFSNPEETTVLLRLDSPGGSVNGYGYASAQLERLVAANITLVVAVDRVAASGGYMMACVADKIIASKFSSVGSIGVVAEFPNVSSLLSRLGVEYKQYTVGDSKRTVSPMGSISEDDEKRFKKSLKKTYKQFCKHIKKYRGVDISKVATGETWSGKEAVSLGLIDEIMTSDEFLSSHFRTHHVLAVEIVDNVIESLADKFVGKFSDLIQSVILKTVNLEKISGRTGNVKLL